MKIRNNYNIVRIQILLFFVFTICLIALIISEKTDKNTSIFAFILYLPYIVILSLYNGLALKILLNFLKNNYFLYVIPVLPFITWFMIREYTITIGLLKLQQKESLIGLSLMLIVNSIGYFFYNIRKIPNQTLK